MHAIHLLLSPITASYAMQHVYPNNQQDIYPNNQQHIYPNNQQHIYPNNQQHIYPNNHDNQKSILHLKNTLTTKELILKMHK
jgi:hypothetical protein